MIFLYRFEILRQDAAIAGVIAPNSLTASQGVDRELHLLTNYERPISFGVTEPFAAPFLPTALGTNGLPTVNGDTHWLFQPAAVEHSGLRLDAEKAAGQITVTLPRAHPISQLYVLDSPGAQVWLTLATLDNEADTNPLVVWVGRVRSAEYDELRCSLSMMHIADVLSRPGLTRKHSRTCPHVLFDPSSCAVKINDYDYVANYWKYREDGWLVSVSDDGLTLTAAEAANHANGFFDHGFIIIGGSYSTDNGAVLQHFTRAQGVTPQGAITAKVHGGIRRAIVAHSGNTLTLATPIPPGDYTAEAKRRVSMFAGCDASKTACQTKFGNFVRYGGYHVIPIKNLFETGLTPTGATGQGVLA